MRHETALLVTHNDKGQVEGVKYDRVAVVLINAVKEQQQQIDRQQKLMEEQQQQAQQAQAQAEQMAKKEQADIMTKYSKSRVDLAKEKELMASTQEKLANISKTQAQTEHETMKADYELVEIMMKLEDMQFGQIKSSFELAQAIKQANKEVEQQQLTTVGG